MKRLLFLLLIIPALACSSTLTEPTANLSAGVSTETAIPAPTPSNTITPDPTATASPGTCEVIAEALHLRDAPNIEGLVIAWLDQGDQLTILSDPPSGDWIRVQSVNNTGWINSQYCER